jgi:hypothetical protein
MEFRKLTVRKVDDEYRAACTSGYTYLVRDNFTSLTAFDTLQGLTQWLLDRNLVLDLASGVDFNAATWDVNVIGAYREESHATTDELIRIAKDSRGVCRKCFNAEYTAAVLIDGTDGVREVHYAVAVDAVKYDIASSRIATGSNNVRDVEVYKTYRGELAGIGSKVRNIESSSASRVIAVEHLGGEPFFVVCDEALDGRLYENEKQWFAPADVVVC